MDLTLWLALAFVVFWVGKLVHHFFFAPKRRKLWAGSVPITDEKLRAWYTEIWWETYNVIAPEDRVHHEPTPHWWMYMDHHFLPSYLGQNLIGYWVKQQGDASRVIFVTGASKENRNLIRHECAHDIMDSIYHSDKYFRRDSYVMKQF